MTLRRPNNGGWPASGKSGERIKIQIDDDTADRLTAAARARGVTVDALVETLLAAASWRVDELLGADDVAGESSPG